MTGLAAASGVRPLGERRGELAGLVRFHSVAKTRPEVDRRIMLVEDGQDAVLERIAERQCRWDAWAVELHLENLVPRRERGHGTAHRVTRGNEGAVSPVAPSCDIRGPAHVRRWPRCQLVDLVAARGVEAIDRERPTGRPETSGVFPGDPSALHDRPCARTFEQAAGIERRRAYLERPDVWTFDEATWLGRHCG